MPRLLLLSLTSAITLLIPFCQRRNLEFIAGMGMLSFSPAQGRAHLDSGPWGAWDWLMESRYRMPARLHRFLVESYPLGHLKTWAA